MTPDAFVKAVEGYYGRYERPVMRAMVAEYLGKYRPADLDVLWRETLLQFSGRYKTQPDIAALEEIWRSRKPEPPVPVRAIDGPVMSDEERGQMLRLFEGLARKLVRR